MWQMKSKELKALSTLTNDELQALMATVEGGGVSSLISLTVGEVLQMLTDDNYMHEWLCERCETVDGYLRGLKSLQTDVISLEKLLKSWQKPMKDVEERAYSITEPKVSFVESIITDCVEWYHLHSTAEAQRLAFSDWLVMAKKRAAKTNYEHNLQKLTEKRQ